VFAHLTYQELQQQRRTPVILPQFSIYITNIPEKTSVVQAFGTWYVKDGPAIAESLQTTSIECTKMRLQCVESTATVSLNEKGLLDSKSTVFEVERWSDEEIITKPLEGRCTTRTITLNLANRLVTSDIASMPRAEHCQEKPVLLKLEDAVKAHPRKADKTS
jgi:hypothetical protein